MEIYIYNKDIELKGIIDTFIFFRWVRKYRDCGEFELHCPLDENTNKLFQMGDIISKKNDSEAGYVETIEKQLGQSGQEKIIIKGKFLIGYFGRRINWGRICFEGKTESLIRKIVKDNVINPENIDRKIPNLILGELKGFEEIIKYQNSFGNILEQIKNIINASNLGCRNILDVCQKKIIFDIYKGVDRSINNNITAPCIFSRDFENLDQQNLFCSSNKYANTCLIAGAGEENNRILTSIENNTGLDRYEIYVDARDITNEKQNSSTKEEIPLEQYKDFLLQRGTEKLEKCQLVTSFQGKISTYAAKNAYKKDFDLGDIISLLDKKWGYRADTRITEIEETYEPGKNNLNLTFGNSIPTIIDRLQEVQ